MRDAGGVREWRLSGRVSAISEGCVLHPLAAAGTPRTYLPCVRFASTHVLPAPPSPTNTHLSCWLATRAIQGPLEKRGRDAAVLLPWDGGLSAARPRARRRGAVRRRSGPGKRARRFVPLRCALRLCTPPAHPPLSFFLAVKSPFPSPEALPAGGGWVVLGV